MIAERFSSSFRPTDKKKTIGFRNWGSVRLVWDRDFYRVMWVGEQKNVHYKNVYGVISENKVTNV